PADHPVRARPQGRRPEPDRGRALGSAGHAGRPAGQRDRRRPAARRSGGVRPGCPAASIDSTTVLTMQDALLALTRYWMDRGCMVVQPFNTEVGAGTLNPATMLRVLGPEPWRVGYVEPSVRPDDSRYGENPNRLQTHTQFQ